MITVSPVRTMTTLGLVVASLGFGTASAAGAGDTGDDPIAAAMSAYRAAYPRISDEQARMAAAGSDDRRAVYDGASRDTATYGGSWFDPMSGVVHVAGTSREAMTRAAELGREYGVDVESTMVRRSMAELEALADRLRIGRDPIGEAARGQVGIDVKTNEVVAAVPEVRVRELAGTMEGVRVVADPGLRIEPDHGCATRFTCDLTIRAGAVIQRTDGGSCSAGFTARTSTSARFVFTAGHCANWTSWTTGAEKIGPDVVSINSGNVDVATIRVMNSWFVNDTGGQIYINGVAGNWVPVVKVAPALAYIVAGDTVCLSANISDPTAANPCGVVGSVADALGRGMVRVDGVDACSGDSGGGWYLLPVSKKREAYGVHSSSDPGCHGNQGGSSSWFTSMPAIKSAFSYATVETR